MVRKTAEERFWAKVRKNLSGCWLWTGKSTNGAGYGVLYSAGRQGYAHRFSWELENKKPIPDGMIVRHTCDNPPCVRPDHLVLGTYRDNVYDMLKRRRFRPSFGESNSQAKLTNADIVAILACHKTGRFGYRRLSRFFGVTPICIKKIVVGTAWRHVIRRDRGGVERSALVGRVMPTITVVAR